MASSMKKADVFPTNCMRNMITLCLRCCPRQAEETCSNGCSEAVGDYYRKDAAVATPIKTGTRPESSITSSMHNIPSIYTADQLTSLSERSASPSGVSTEPYAARSASVLVNIPSSRRSSTTTTHSSRSANRPSDAGGGLIRKEDNSHPTTNDRSRTSSPMSTDRDELLPHASGSMSRLVPTHAPGARRFSYETPICPEMLQPALYQSELPLQSEEERLTDDEKLAKYQLGELHLHVQFSVPEKSLTIRLIEARGLPTPKPDEIESRPARKTSIVSAGRRESAVRINPYIKAALLPERKLSCQTAIKKNTTNPVFEEEFRFELNYEQTLRKQLLLSVIDFERDEHKVLGEIKLVLGDLDLIQGEEIWKPLLPPSHRKLDLGELLVSLNYLPNAERLTVDIIKAKQLLQTDLVGGSDPYVQLALIGANEKVLKTKQTTTKKDTLDPVFNESFHFDIKRSDLEEVSLVLSVWDWNSKSRNDFVGRVVLGAYATGPKEETHWTQMMRKERTPIAEWHGLKNRKEADNISRASQLVT